MRMSYPVPLDQLTAGFLSSCSYTDFVGAINQWNVPPGSYDTLSRWRVFGDVTTASRLFEVACTTGFSCREMARATGCTAEGIDISALSVRLATYNAARHGAGGDTSYICGDALTHPALQKYTHVVVGAAARFFPEPMKLIDTCTDLLDDGGAILASPFYVHQRIPGDLVARAREVFGITVTNESYAEVFEPYAGLTVRYEQHITPRQETEAELRHYCDSTVQRFAEDAGVDAPDVLEVAHGRLLAIKRMSNDLRPYQRYAVLVLGFDRAQYPRRYVELF